ncbi:MAG: hypothetical protein AAF988_05985, partial [Pseudomonadota bacterium]
PELGVWSTSQNNFQMFFYMSNRPDDSLTASEELARFATNIDTHLSDEVVQGAIDASSYENEDCDTFSAEIINGVSYFREILKFDFDTEEIAKAYGEMTPDDVRRQAKNIMSGLKGMHVQGPEPEKPLSLEQLRDMMPAPAEPSMASQFNSPTVSA